MDLNARKVLLSPEFLSELSMDDYVQNRYEASISQVPKLENEGPEDARRREISYLNLEWFMQTLLDRMNRTSGSLRPVCQGAFCRPAHYRISVECPLGK